MLLVIQMVAETASSVNSTFHGLRPFNSARDLGAVALLLEQAFREDLGFLHTWSRVPVLRELGSYLWAASFAPAMPESLLGFVWEEEGRIIGNVTLTPDETRRRHWMISNVAVDEKYRRRGIAREMMQASIVEARQRGAHWLILNVRPHNVGAIKLYQELGFEAVDTEMGYTLKRAKPSSMLPFRLRRLQSSEYRSAFDLARAGMSERLKLFRPLRASEFALHIEDQVAERVMDFFIGQATERWGYFESLHSPSAPANGLAGTHSAKGLRATVLLHAQRIGTPHSFDIRVAPDARGHLEEGLVAFALERLAQFPRREITTRLLTSHHQLVEVLTREGFVETRGLMLMAKEMSA